jgi:nitrogen regulatory protein PII
MRLVITIVDRGQGERVSEFGIDNHVDYSFLTHGQGTVRSEMLNLLGLGTIEKDIVTSFIPEHAVKGHLAGLSGLLNLKRPGKGIAFTISMSALNALIAHCVDTALPIEDDEEKEVKHMPPKFSLIVVISEAGYVDKVMHAAREAGATGGTLLQARGVGNESTQTFLGEALSTEKELIMIIAARAAYKEIMSAINKSCGLLTGAKGIVFSLPVEDIAGIGE